MKNKTSYVYCIFRLDRKHWSNINDQLRDRGYKHMRCFIPTVSIIRKTRNGRNITEEMPLLFNFGFIRMSTKRAYNRQFLRELKREIPGINGWMLSLESMHPKRLRKRVDTEDFDDFSKVAIITKEQYKYYKRLSKKNQVYTMKDILNTPPGSYITLKGYPFNGLSAQLEDINYMNRTAIVKIFPGGNSELKMQLPLDNILYTIYDDYEDPLVDDHARVDVDTLSEQDQPLEDEFEVEID